MKLTILSNAFHPEPIGIAAHMAELAEALAQHGHEVQVATVFPHYPHWIIQPHYRGKLWAQEEWQGCRVLRTWMRVSRKPTFVAKMIYYLSFTISSALGSLSWGRQDLVLVSSPPPSLILTACFYRMLHRTRTVLSIADLLPDTAVALGMIKNKWVIKVLYAFEKWCYRQSDHIVVISDAFRHNLLQKGVPPEKISVVYTWANTDFIRPLPKDNSFREKHELGDKFVVLYAGNIGISQGLETLLEAARQIQEDPSVQFVIVGDGTTKADLQRRAEQMELSNVVFLPLQPREDLPLLYGAADVCVVLQKKTVLDINVPGKIQTIMSAGRAMIAATHPQGIPAKLVRDSGGGLLIAPENAAELAEAIQKLRRQPELRAVMGNAGRRYALKHFSLRSAVRSYMDIFGQALAADQQALPRKQSSAEA